MCEKALDFILVSMALPIALTENCEHKFVRVIGLILLLIWAPLAFTIFIVPMILLLLGMMFEEI